MSYSGGDQSDGGCEDGLVMQLQCSDGPLLDDFFDKSGFFSGGSRSSFVLGIEESPVEVSQAVA